MRESVRDYSSQPVRNLLTNPSAETPGNAVTVWQNLITNPSFETVSTGAAVMRTNLTPNPIPASPAGWNVTNFGGGSTNLTYDATNTALAATMATGAINTGFTLRYGLNSVGSSETTRVPVTPGAPYTQSIQVMSTVADSRAYAIDWMDASNNLVGGVGTVTSNYTLPANTWVTMTVIGTAPDSAVSASIHVIYAGTSGTPVIRPAGSVLYVRRALFEQTDQVRSYFDGSTASALGWTYGWSGTVNASASTAKAFSTTIWQNQVSNSSMRVAQSGTTILRTNLCLNPANLSVSSTWGGSVDSGGNPTYTYFSTQGPSDGPPTFRRLTVSGVGAGGASDIVGQYILSTAQNVTPGAVYTGSLYGRTSVAASSYARIYWLTGTGSIISSSDGTQANTTANAWARRSVTATAPANAVKARLDWRSVASQMPLNSTLDVTGALFEQTGQLRPYFDGTTLPQPGWTTAWSGPVNNSASTAKATSTAVWTNQFANPSLQSVASGATTLRTNLCTNPNFDVAGSTNWVVKGPATVAPSTVVSHSGTTSLAITATSSGLNAGGGINLTGLTIGAKYTLSAWVYVPSTNVTPRAVATVAAIGYGTNTADVRDSWIRLSYTITATATVHNFGFDFHPNQSTIGDVIYVDDVLIEQTDQLRPYFDGSTASAQGWGYAWTGVAGTSTSIAKATAVAVRTNGVSNPHAISGGAIWGNQTPKFDTPNTVTYNPTGAQDGGSAYSVTIGSGVLSGDKNLRISVSTVNGGGIASGTPIAVSMDIFAPEAMSGSIELGFGTAGADIFAHSDSVALNVGAWTRISAIILAPATATSVKLMQFLGTVAPSSGSTYLASRALLEVNSSVNETYFDGNTSSSGDFGYGWTSTANSSTSQQTAPKTAEDVGFAPYSIAYVSQGRVYTGTSSAGVKSTASAPAGTSLFFQTSDFTTVVANTPYTFYAYVYVPTGTAPVRLEDPNNAAVGTASTVFDAWTKITLTYSPTQTTTFLRVRSAGVTAPGTTFYVGAKGFLLGRYTGNHFDGSMPSTGDFTPTWAGTAHASTTDLIAPAPSYFGTAGPTSKRWTSYDSTGTPVLLFRTDGANVNNGTNRLAFGGATISANSTYTMIITAQASVSSSWVYGIDSVGDPLGGGSFTIGTTPTTVYRTFTSGATAVGNGGFIRANDTAAIGATLTITKISLVSGIYTGPHFDGDTPSTGDLLPVWTGALQNSVSEMRGVQAVGISNGNNVNGGNAKSYVSYARSIQGSYSVVHQAAGNATGDEGGQVVVSGLTIGNVYTAVVFLYQPSLYTTSGIRIGTYTAGVGWSGTSSWNTTVGAWTKLTYTFTATGTSTALVIGAPQISGGSTTPAPPAVGATYYLDSVMMVLGSYSGPYFDGSTPLADTDLTTSWSGVAHASTTTVTAPGVLLTSPHSDTRSIQSSQWSLGGLKSVRMIPVVNLGGYTDFNLPTGSWSVGQTITAVATRRTSVSLATTSAGRLGIRFWGATDVNLNQAMINLPIAAGITPTRLAAVVPPGTTTVSIRLYDGGSPGQPDVWWDNVGVYEGNYQGPYLDGDSPDAVWEGTAHNSTSKGYPVSPNLITNLITYPNVGDPASTILGSSGRWTLGSQSLTTARVADSTGSTGFVFQTTATASGRRYMYANSSNMAQVQVGQMYTGMIRARQISGTLGPAYLTIVPRNPVGAGLGDIVGTSITPTALGQWVWLRSSGVAPAGTVGMQLQGNFTATSGDVWQWDDAMLVAGDYSGDYSDGNTPGWKWTGAQNASTSYGYPYTMPVAPLVSTVSSTNSTITAPSDLPALAGRTLYLVYRATTTTTNFEGLGGTGNTSGQGGILLQAPSPAGNQPRARFDFTGGSSNQVIGLAANSWTLGGHVVVASLNDGMTRASFMAENAPQATMVIPNPGSGLTLFPTKVNVNTNIVSTPVAIYLFKGEHDAATKAAIIAWLRNHYGI